MFPSKLQENIVPRKVLSGTVYNSRTENNITTTYDALWLFSSKEMYRPGGSYDGIYYTSEYIGDYEGELYPSQDILNGYIVNSTSTPTINRFYKEDGATTYPWSRSLFGGNSVYAVYFSSYGRPSWSSVDVARGVAPGFCLK